MTLLRHTLLITLLSGLGACTERSATTTSAEPAGRADPEMMQKRAELLQRKSLERPPQPDQPITGEVPDEVLHSAMQALEQLTGAARSAFTVVVAEETIWPNGALGCPLPGMVYTDATVPGYRVVLEHQRRKYDYRSGGTRYQMLCLEPSRMPSGTQAPTS